MALLGSGATSYQYELHAQRVHTQVLHLCDDVRTGARFEQVVRSLEVGELAAGGERRARARDAAQEGAGEQRQEEGADSGHGRLRHLSAEKVAVFVAFGAVSAPIAPDDIVQTPAQAEGNSRPPLLVMEPLRAFLDAHGLGEGELRATPIGEGHSNVTYLIERGGSEVVLRRPPRPPLPPSAHDVLREARLLSALASTPARVPEVLAVCEDPATIGAPFYVMERIEGEVIVSSVPAALDTPAQRRRIGEQLIDALVEIHAVDWRAAGLGGLRQADRLPGAPAATLHRPVGAEQDA